MPINIAQEKGEGAHQLHFGVAFFPLLQFIHEDILGLLLCWAIFVFFEVGTISKVHLNEVSVFCEKKKARKMI